MASVSEDLEEMKEWADSLQIRAKAEAERFEAAFQEEKQKVKDAWDAFVRANDNLKKIKQIIVACEYESEEIGRTPPSTPPRKKTKTKKKLNIRRNDPLSSVVIPKQGRRGRRDWTESDVERLEGCSSRLDTSLFQNGGDFYREIHRMFGPTQRTVASIASKARNLGIQLPD